MEAKTCFCSRPPSLLRVCAYKGGRPIPCQSILDACCQPVGGSAGCCLWNISRASQQVAVSWRRAAASDRTIEPSNLEGSTPGGLILSGSKVKASLLKAGGGYKFGGPSTLQLVQEHTLASLVCEPPSLRSHLCL